MIAQDLRAGVAGWHPVEDMSFTLSELAQATGGRLLDAASEVIIDRLVTDSRQAGPGALFVALAGEAMDGHDFIMAAVEAGASALLCQQAPEQVRTPRVIVRDTREALVAFSRERLAVCGVRVVAVTGSAGKTTTKEMIAAVLERRARVLKTEGNLNTYTGLPMTLAHLQPDHQVFVAEYGMSALGEIAFLARMAPPDIAVVLNVGMAHLGMLGSIEQIATAKRELVEALPESGIAVLNGDDPRVAAMAAAVSGRVVHYGVRDQGAGADGADYFATGIQLHGLSGTSFTLHAPGGTIAVTLAVPGMHTVSNAVAAAAVGDLNGVPLADIAAALADFRPVTGRMNIRPGRLGSLVIDDAYNASPGSMEAALQVLGSETERTRIAVLGDMLELGDQAVGAHHRVGRAAAAAADVVVAIGEHAGALVGAARGSGMDPERAIAVTDIDQAVEAVEPHLAGALVLVKASRGMALDRVVDRLVKP